MSDSDFVFGESLLFLHTSPATLSTPDSAERPQDTDTLDDGLEFSQSLLFQQHPPQPLNTLSRQTPENLNKHERTKMVKLLDGSTLELRPRRKKQVIIEIEKDSDDAILNMDKLYERVNKREELRNSQKEIRALKQQSQNIRTSELLHLWLEKYKPKSFMQICSAGNERQYWHVKNWLSKWGPAVFGHEKSDNEPLDSLGRPLRKILLVHGPPGIGKTAVVHLFARQAGYCVEELNAANSMNALQGAEASDGAGRFANATAALKLKVKNALTTNSITSNGKPTCLIVDEIDSTANANEIVKVLSELVRVDQANRRKKEDKELRRDSKKKSSKKPFSLNRPIICIANDMYNTAAKSGGPNPMEILRPLCEIIAFRKSTTGSSVGEKINVSAQNSVIRFLMKISENENLGLDRKEIAEVFEICDGDIRACINYLQFSSRKLDSDLHSFTPDGEFCKKDSLVSWFTLVDQIFSRNQTLSKEENFEKMLNLVFSGEGKSAAAFSLDKVVRGCFNKYLDVVHLQDDSVVRPAEISDWLFFYDLLTTQNFNSQFYPTLTSLKFWSLFSDINPQKFRDSDGLIPNARNLDFNSREVLKQNRSIVKKLADLVPVNSKVSLCGMSSNGSFYASEFIPFLDIMLSPEIGSSKSKLSLKSHEAILIEKLADLIKKLDIKLESQRDIETNEVYLMYGPDWESMTMFTSGEQDIDQKKKSLNIKRQWLFPLLQSELDSLASTGLLKRQRAEMDQEKKEASQKRTKMATSLDFFKGRYDDLLTKVATAAKPINREAMRIWVKHHEGFSNAVRKNIGWHELWN
ncbi:P-loop containing nucleoside triphosphate hydrolase protein [Metschnikowia bicuspidata var. bicuspidata NRRL YB-4993]|uniref:p-loop containing nucleoside triphosphate hydrolase protein n=1 Tax=Metschnikowia bicuspidata var. bicuspidata NRRL YB-4993 TaxID=869754 RepID=A0A1A0HIX9_9ASCO|nr:P-loop containing nucleoside triphosphate hydrolase protein [Metschnikowia bicuspidata var. bicuspidata NRRL YB-4993]OBA23970.1 P-loop containing nucleoside triphosphate hydrolase protein [Metschnikowia bicuspidata var. bicuspidata NRRL YB-4993]